MQRCPPIRIVGVCFHTTADEISKQTSVAVSGTDVQKSFSVNLFSHEVENSIDWHVFYSVQNGEQI